MQRLISAFWIALMVAVSTGDAAATEVVTPLLMEVEVNGVATGEVFLFMRNGNQLLMAEEGFARLNLKRSDDPALSQEDMRFFALGSTVIWKLDDERQLVSLTAKPAAFQTSVIRPETASDTPIADQPIGFFMNYDLIGQHGRAASFFGGQMEAVASSRWGVFSTSANSVSGYRPGLARLDTSYRRDWRDGLAQLTIGDSILPGGFMGVPIRFGGIHIGRDFSIDPGYVAFPLASLRGEAALPSTMEVYIDNALRYRGEVQAGPFEVKSLPVLSGAGQAEIVLKDLLGRRQTVTSSFYAAPQLLAADTHDFTYAAGAERLDYGISSFAYDTPLVAGLHRYGLTDTFTGEIQAIASTSQQVAGFSLGALIPQLGVINAGIAGSRQDDGAGTRVRFAFSRELAGYNLNASYTTSTADFELPGRSETRRRPLEEMHAGAGFSLGSYGSASMGFDRLRLSDRSSTSIFSVQYGLGIGPGYISAYGSAIRDRSTSMFAGLTFTMPLGTSSSVTASVEHGTSGGVLRTGLSGRVTEDGSIGYRGSLSHSRLLGERVPSGFAPACRRLGDCGRGASPIR